jgi:cellulose synthase/poly-beta-1,6-N-acetylglucosamine synthase-like glycosyltransferase
MCITLFWVPLGLMVYHWLLFPLLLWTWARLIPGRNQPAESRELLSVSILIAAHNEEAVLSDKIRNCMDIDYPRDKVELIIGSDASTDRTDEIVRSFADRGVRLIRCEPRTGKSGVLNRLFREATGDLVLCTDADVLVSPASLSRMAERMRDPRVGVVMPRYVRVNTEGSPAESLYDRWETKIKELEGGLGATVGTYGGALLIRKSLADPIPDDTILDDFVLGIRPFRSGYDVVCEPAAVAVTRAEVERLEFERKVRIGRGNIQGLVRNFDLLSPRYGRKAWVYFSHKVIRMGVPLLLLSMLFLSSVLSASSFFGVVLALQLLAYVTIPALLVLPRKLRKFLWVQYYLYLNIALLVGYWQHFFNRRPAYNWLRTARR